jgi:uncharacterized protein (TIGR03437 family)
MARFLVLPTGEVMLSSQQPQIYIYRPDPAEGTHEANWAPSIVNCPTKLVAGGHWALTGKGLNGLSQANSYGDDAQMATNYPLVRVTAKAGGADYYLRTHDFSTLGVAVAGNQTCTVETPKTVPPGDYSLCVVANGIASAPVPITISAPGEALLG